MKGMKTYLAIAAGAIFALAAFASGQSLLLTGQVLFLAFGIAALRYSVQAVELLMKAGVGLRSVPNPHVWLVWLTQIVVIALTAAAYVFRLQGGEYALQIISLALGIAFLGSGVSKAGKAAVPT